MRFCLLLAGMLITIHGTMAADGLYEAEMVFDPASGSHGHVHASCITQYPNGDLLVVWYENGDELPPEYFSKDKDKSDNVRTGAARRRAAESQFDPPLVIAGTVGLDHVREDRRGDLPGLLLRESALHETHLLLDHGGDRIEFAVRAREAHFALARFTGLERPHRLRVPFLDDGRWGESLSDRVHARAPGPGDRGLLGGRQQRGEHLGQALDVGNRLHVQARYDHSG